MVPWTKTYQFLWLLILWGQQPVLGAVFPGSTALPRELLPPILPCPLEAPPPLPCATGSQVRGADKLTIDILEILVMIVSGMLPLIIQVRGLHFLHLSKFLQKY